MRFVLPLALVIACENPEVEPDPALLELGLELPLDAFVYDLGLSDSLEGAAALDNTPDHNPITDAGATLGRVLFYDPELSANGSVACASCHLGDAGFADTFAASEGFEGGLTGRKSMPLVNIRYYGPGRMFWDERADTLEDQVLMPIQDEIEMGLTLDELVERVEAAPYYSALFSDAFGDDEVSSDRISLVLAQFVRSMESFGSTYDEGLRATGDPRLPFPNFSDAENRGKAIFFGEGVGGGGPLCAACHFAGAGPPGTDGPPPTGWFFGMPGPRVNGLPDPEDAGIGDRTGRPEDRGRFKSPSLRSVALRAPYMHDGRFDTLQEVVEFYDHEIAPSPNLDPALRGPGGQPIRLGLSAEDKAALVAFLETLTDTGPAFDPRFANPFVE